MFRMKEQDQTTGEQSNMDIGNLTEKQSRVMIIKMIKRNWEETRCARARNYKLLTNRKQKE